MATTGAQRMKYGGPFRVVLVMSPAPLLERMAEVVNSTEGVELAGSFGSASDAVDWSVWNRPAWHYAYVDMTLPDNGGEEVAKHLLSSPRAGTVIGVSAHLWREVRERLAKLGVADILEKGDLIAFQGHLESRVN